MNYFERLAEDLLTLEVNTIVKSNMTGGKMPSSKRRALLEIADLYRETLVDYGVARYAAQSPENYADNEAALKSGRLLRWRFGGEYSFVEIRSVARRAIDHYNEQEKKKMSESEADELGMRKAIVLRIFRQSGNLIGLFKARRAQFSAKIDSATGFDSRAVSPDDERAPYPSQSGSEGWNNDVEKGQVNAAPDMKLDPDQVALVRKVWEIGTQQILMQTVVQLDGDVTSFISQRLLDFPLDAKKTFMTLHDESVRTSTSIWMNLFKTVGDLAGKALGQIFPGK